MKIMMSVPMMMLVTMSTTSSPVHAEDRNVIINVDANTIYDISKVKGYESVVTKDGFVKTRILFSQKFVLRPAGKSEKSASQPKEFQSKYSADDLTKQKAELKNAIDNIIGKVDLVKDHPILKLRDSAYILDTNLKKFVPNVEAVFKFGDFLKNRRRARTSVDNGVDDITVTSEKLAELTSKLESVEIVSDLAKASTASTDELSPENLKKYGVWNFRKFSYTDKTIGEISAVDVEVSWALEIQFDPKKKDIAAFAGINPSSDEKLADKNPSESQNDTPKGGSGTEATTVDAGGAVDIFSAGFLEKLANRPGIDTVYAYGLRNSGEEAASYYGFEFNTPGVTNHPRIPLNFYPFWTRRKDGKNPPVFKFDATRLRTIAAVDSKKSSKSVLGALSWSMGPSVSFYYGYNFTWPQNNMRTSPALGVAIKFSLSALGASTPSSEDKSKGEKLEAGPVTVKVNEKRIGPITAPSLSTKTAGIIYIYPKDPNKPEEDLQSLAPTMAPIIYGVQVKEDGTLKDLVFPKESTFFIDWREASDSKSKEKKPLIDPIFLEKNKGLTISIEQWNEKSKEWVKKSDLSMSATAGAVYRLIISKK